MTPWRRARLSARRLARLARPDSLRGRLMLSMLGVLVLGTAAASSLDEVNLAALLPRALSGRRLGGLGLLLREPYQDITVLVAFSVMMLLLIWLVSGWSLAPLRRASQEAAAVGPGHQARISPDGMPGEIRPLILAFNGALDRLAAAYALEQRFTADAAHELRTPLAVLDLRLQRARAQGRFDVGVEGELAQLKRVVGQLFDLARKEQAPPVAGLAGEPTVNLSRAAREAAATVSLLIDAAGRDLVVDLPPRLAVPGRAEDLRDMVRNLLDNALAHGAGRIRLSACLALPLRQGAGPEALLEVSDEGEGVAADLAPGMFERFRKGRSGSPGSGLGLAIVSEVARSHGGSVGFAPGAGCRVQVRLPAARE
ncbi:MAG: sensor histidine kinase [Janthinobacterium lividum]